MSSHNQCTQEEFVVMLRRAELDPDQHDVAELHAAWLLLESHMQRLCRPSAEIASRHSNRSLPRQPGTQPLAVFNPHDFMRASDKSEL